ncbi:MAG: hypothetical protein H7259_07575, partial [Cytophagales bacterium]|nr:hypothetical protein [Cytophaga sp.]
MKYASVLKEYTFVSLFFLLIAILFTWPLSLYLSEGFMANPHNSDAVQYIWNSWVFESSLKEGSNPFYTHQALFPEGANLWMHTYTPLLSAFSVPFANNILGINIFILIQYTLSGVGAYALCKRITLHWIPSLLTGIIFSFSPFKLLHTMEHYHLILTATIPFFISCFLNAFTFTKGFFIPKINSIHYLVLSILLGIVTFLSDYYATFFLIYFCLLWAFWHYFVIRWNSYSVKKRWILFIAVFTLCHVIVEKLIRWGIDDKGGLWWGGDFIMFFIPNQSSVLYDWNIVDTFRKHFMRMQDSLEYQLFLGFASILLLTLILFFCIKKKTPHYSGPWILILLVFIMICIPRLTVGGINIIYLPNALLHFTPFFNNLRCPARIEVLIFLLIPLCGTWMMYSASTDSWLFRYKNNICCLLIVFSIIELMPHRQPMLLSKDIPLIMKDIQSMEGKVFITIPLGVRDGMRDEGFIDLNDLFYQTVHHKSSIGGYISRVPEKSFRMMEQDAVVATLLKLSAVDSDTHAEPPTKDQIALFFKTYEPSGVLIHPEYINSNAH